MATKVRKPNGNSKLDSLKPPSRVTELRDGLLSGWTYVAALDWLRVECGVSSGMDALSRFYRRHCVPILQEKKKWAALEAEGLAKMGKESQVFEDAAMAEAIEFAFAFLRDPLGDPEQKRKWLESLIKKKGGEREDVKVSILKRKADAADEAAELKRQLNAGGKLMPTQQREAILAKMDEVLGIAK